MSDITTVWNVALGKGDWVISGGQLQSGDDLATAVLISLFTDGLADASDAIPDGSNDRRGWWGDLDAEFPIGSKLWLLSREKLTQSVATRAVRYATDALQWMKTVGVAASIGVTAAIYPPTTLALTVVIRRTDGTTETVAFNWAWDQMA